MKTPYDKIPAEQPSLDRMRADRVALEAYLRKQKPGAMLDYLSISRETKVAMNARGKRILRSALAHLDLVVATVRGCGVRLSSADSAIDIVEGDLDRIGRVVKRATSRHATMRDAHADEMNDAQRRAFFLRGAGLAAVAVALSAKSKPMRALPPEAPAFDMVEAAEARS